MRIIIRSFLSIFKNVISFCVVPILCELLAFLYPKPPKHNYRGDNYKSWQWIVTPFNPPVVMLTSLEALISVLCCSSDASACISASVVIILIDVVTVYSNFANPNPCIQ